MRDFFVFICIAGLTVAALAQQPTMPTPFGESRKPGTVSSDDSKLKDMWESKIKMEWEAIKNQGQEGLRRAFSGRLRGRRSRWQRRAQ